MWQIPLQTWQVWCLNADAGGKKYDFSLSWRFFHKKSGWIPIMSCF